MTIQKGSDVRIALGDGASPEAFTNIGGDQNATVRFNDEEADFTNKGSTNLWRERMDGGTIRDVEIQCELVLLEDTSLDTIVAALFGTGSRHQSMRAVVPGFANIDCAAWHISEMSMGGSLNEAASCSFTARSAGAVTFTAT